MIWRLTTKRRVWDIDEEHKRYKRYDIGAEPPEEWQPMSNFLLHEPRVSRKAFPGRHIREFTVFGELDDNDEVQYWRATALTWEEIDG